MRWLILLALIPSFAWADDAVTSGNSAFAVNLFSKMNAMEYASYLETFNQVMTEGKPAETYEWSTSRAKGKISVGEFFVTKAEQYCRPFSEGYSVDEEGQTFRGIACRNSRGGWCKLREHSGYNCALIHPDGLDGWMLDTSVEIDHLNNDVRRTKYRWNSFTSSLPF